MKHAFSLNHQLASNSTYNPVLAWIQYKNSSQICTCHDTHRRYRERKETIQCRANWIYKEYTNTFQKSLFNDQHQRWSVHDTHLWNPVSFSSHIHRFSSNQCRKLFNLSLYWNLMSIQYWRYWNESLRLPSKEVLNIQV